MRSFRCKMSGRCLVLFALCGILNADISISKLKEKPGKFKNVQGCYVEELDAVVPFEQARPSAEGCLEYRCEKNWLYHVGCGLAVALPPFELVEDKEKPYPDCCPRLKDSPTSE